jgi:uncharacterized protein YybS (DUF2232 family)
MHYRNLIIATVQTVGLFLAAFVIPLLGQVLALFTPVPLIILSVRHGKEKGLIALVASSAIVAALGGWQLAAILFLSFGLMAIGISEGMRANWKHEQTSLLGGLLPIVVLGVILAVYFSRIGKNPVTVAEDYLRSSLAETAKFYASMKLTDMAAMVSAVSDTFVHYLVRLSPGIIIATSVAQAACCYGIARAVIMRRPGAGPMPVLTPFSLWHAPDSWVWGLIAALALIVVPQETFRFFGWNLAIIFGTVYLAQGTAIADFYLRKIHVKTFARGVILGLVLAMPSIVFVIALGIVDIWADLRKVRVPEQKA